MAAVTYTSDELGVAEVAAALERVGFDVGRVRRVERRLLDTFDGRLHAAGLRLELRTGERTELVVHGPGEARAQVDVRQPPRLAEDLPAGPVRTRLSHLLEVRALLPVVAVEGMEVDAARRNVEGKVVVGATLYDRPALGDGQVVAPVAAELQVLEAYAKPGARAADLLTGLEMERHDRLLVELAADKAGVDLAGFAGSPTVALDPAEPALMSAVANLVDNAVKYSDARSSVNVTGRLRDGWVEVAVSDRGIGIPPQDLERVFERFYRVDRARSRETGGTGLGLSIVRHVATNHDGEVTVCSTEGEGSTFTLRIPTRSA